MISPGVPEPDRALPRERLYRLTISNAVAYTVFTVFAFVCFIYLPLFNGVTGTGVFVPAAHSMAREDAQEAEI